MHKITFFTEAVNKPQWLFLRNEIYTTAFAGIEAKNCAASLAPAAGVLRSILKANMRICFATFEECDLFGEVGSGRPAFVTAFSSFDKQGQRELRGDMFYRDVVRMSLYPRLGRVGHQWWRGCLDSSDIIELENIGRGSRVAPIILEIMREASAAYNFGAFDQQLLMSSEGVLTRSTGETSYYTESHAQTRWRRRTKGKLVDCARELFGALEMMSSALENSRYWQSVGVRISPASVHRDLCNAVLVGESVYQAVDRASKAGSDESDQGGEMPVLRFGPAWETLIAAWDFAQEQGKKPLEELQKKYPTHSEGGDQYIDTDFLYFYNELLESIIGRVALTANADWFNPRAYKNQITPMELRRLPDIIELAF